ncbi:MAG: exosortase/archaeosortase family protein [Candidatus Lokiarchaeota archaeon]|nr:exosortase/archaeosortase family protein [Candidatus Lokiarchaeota archaeon]
MLKNKSFLKIKKPVIEFNESKYIFSIRSLILLAVGAPISAYLVYLFFDLEINMWLHEIVVKQTVYFLNLFFNMGVTADYNPVGKNHWSFNFNNPGLGNISFETFCTGVQAVVIFIGVIVFTPHSQDPDTKRDIIWRKTKSLIISSVIFYVVNIIRMLIQLQLYYIGYAWEDIHFSISAASSFIAAIIVLLMHRWIPEFIISIIYIGTLVSEPIKQKRKETIKDRVSKSNKVELKLMRKILSMDKKTFSEDISKWSKDFGYAIDGAYLKIPAEETSNFIELLMQDKSFQKKNLDKN